MLSPAALLRRAFRSSVSSWPVRLYSSKHKTRPSPSAVEGWEESVSALDAREREMDGRFRELVTMVKANSLQEAIKCYESTKDVQSPSKRYYALSLLLGSCQKAEDLPVAIRLFDDMLQFHMIPNEAAYVALIRCYADANQFKESMKILQKMDRQHTEIRLRCCHPIIESLCRSKKIPHLRKAFELIAYMREKDIKILPEQLMLLVDAIYQGRGRSNKEMVKKLETVLMECSEYLFDMEQSYLVHIVSQLRSVDEAVINEEGVITAAPIDTSQLRIPEPLSQPRRRGPSSIEDLLSRDSAPVAEPINVKEPLKAGIVKISHETCLCPNCGTVLRRNLLTDDEKRRVRECLYLQVGLFEPQQLDHLKTFSAWLRTVHEFHYIIDAANIAYTRQNNDNGKFSYRQIELAVDHLQHLYPDKKILIILPKWYLVGDRVPNSVHKVKKFQRISNDDKRIICKLRSQHSVYEVPHGANDDWYWIYATISEGKKETAYVVTNDMMRDHRSSFFESRLFLRWRNAHIALFNLPYGVDDTKQSPEVYLTDPAPFGREIQFSENGIIHIPAKENSSWLCANLHSEVIRPSLKKKMELSAALEEERPEELFDRSDHDDEYDGDADILNTV